jgi:muconate cycloisomerase
MTDTISAVRLTTVNTPRHRGITCGHVIVELETTGEHTGLGEMSDLQHLPRYHPDVPELERTLHELLVGTPVGAVTAVNTVLEQNFPAAGHIYDKSRAIRCGVDIAAWDLAAKALGVRVCDLMGGQVRPGLPIAHPVFRQRAPEDVPRNLDLVADRLAEGFDCVRVYVGRDLGLDERFLRGLRDRFGDAVRIKSLDFSNLLSAKRAAGFVRRVADVGFDVVEAPAPDHDLRGLAQVRAEIEQPVSEHTYSYRWALQLVEADAVDVFNVSVIAIGGLSGARKILAIAEAAGKDVIIGTTQELSIGTAAAAHLGVASPVEVLPSDPVGPRLYTRDVVREPVRYEGGVLRVPSGPGLGMELDPDRLRAGASPLTWAGTSAGATVDRAATPAALPAGAGR